MTQIAEKGTFIETSEAQKFPTVEGRCLPLHQLHLQWQEMQCQIHTARDGMPYCRKPLKRLGRRGLIREQDEQPTVAVCKRIYRHEQGVQRNVAGISFKVHQVCSKCADEFATSGERIHA